ncbi:uncharacterized protein LOC122851330 isoform X2 [Aphidius gifuensis]|uniref:uncharacterized protein LOC122851330 isoform X2 n=1 Tax=Aphidius gifuensis TaxID=684658 RepID=UPI001CDD4206|nr:uncharacterized protein LOC122851330 isoform X2 [Aphidius gifuensis]
MWLILFSYLSVVNCLQLTSYISSGGLHGEIHFKQGPDNSVTIHLALNTTLQYPEQQWLWSITKFPVDYTKIDDRCDDEHLGEKIIDLTDILGPLILPGNETSVVNVPGINLTGENGLWGKGIILIDTLSTKIICASIIVHEKNYEKHAEAKFYGPISGSIWFRWLGGNSASSTTDTIIYSDLYHTNIFDNSKDIKNCNTLQSIFDPNNQGYGKSIGDIDKRLGKIKISNNNKKLKNTYKDKMTETIPVDVYDLYRSLYIIIFHETMNDSFLTCAKIKPRKVILTKSLINSHGIKGEITFTQETPYHPTWINVTLNPIDDLETRLRYETKTSAYKIHQLPRDPLDTSHKIGKSCSSTKEIFNPVNIDDKAVPPPGLGTQDQYAIGDLSGKLQGRIEGMNHHDILPGSAKLNGIYWDVYLPLSGSHSVVHRSLVIYKYDEINNKDMITWICSNIVPYASQTGGPLSVQTAQAVFHYPIVGRIIFRQVENEPDSDTTIIVEKLIHADGRSTNNSADHRWMIHDNPPGKDYYNWTARCISAGKPYNPYKIDWDILYPEHCTMNRLNYCRLGDLTRHGHLHIAGQKLYGLNLTKILFTDSLLPLSGPQSIIGKSLVIYDDHGPVARGERLACTIISRVHRNKAVAKDWFGNGQPISLHGKFEFIQQTEYDITGVELLLEDLDGKTNNYQIYKVPVEIDLEFPCEPTSLYDSFDPFNMSDTLSPPSGKGTNDQYGIGNLSGKFGTLENRSRYSATFNDTTLPLFGYQSILGRSIIIHKKDNDFRWACSSIERGYAPSEAREIRAIASFHHPYGFAWGYIRMTQLIYNDNSKSETIIEVKLRYPGENDKNTTRNHNWEIWVNGVGVDAVVKVKDTRCVAGGYIWNPYFTQLADPLNQDLYRQECGPDLPLRCYVGDLSARLGPIDIGLERKIFIDKNFPLEGVVTAVGRSIVIFDENFGNQKLACATIQPDYDFIKYANIRRPPRFVVPQFLEDVRKVMGIPEWMLSVDSRKTKILHNGACIQFLLHFKGPIAGRLEKDFSKLLATGKLDEPSLSITGYISTKRKKTLAYRQCNSRDPNANRKNDSSTLDVSVILRVTYLFLFQVIIFNSN